MEPELAAALLGAFVGAVAGGAASFLGSVIVNRLQLRREMRIRMYDVLLPKLINRNFFKLGARVHVLLSDDDETTTEFQQTMTDLVRASVIAGREEAARVSDLQKLVFDPGFTYAVRLKDSKGRVTIPEADRKVWRETAEEIGRKLLELNDYLAHKLV